MMYEIMRTLKCAWLALLLVPGLMIAQTSVVRAATLSNSQEPGSVLVFPYFQTGTVWVDNNVSEPKTEIHIGVTCPTGVTCPELMPVKVHADWVCPGSENPSSSFVCKESDFVLFTTINGKITLTPNGPNVPPCQHGYLVVYVVNIFDQPIKFDGLIGDAVVRVNGEGTALSAYNAIPIQAANPGAATGSLITTGIDPHTGQATLLFDGLGDDYATVTGQLTGDVKFDNKTTPPLFNKTRLILLTLDVQSNFPNNPTFVDFVFYNAKQSPTSTGTNFVCWQERDITAFNPGLTQASQGTAEGSFVSNQANKVQIQGISDGSGPATLLGLILTTEGNAPSAAERSYITAPYNNSIGVPTTFALESAPPPLPTAH
jgi:hypothetical protein